MQETATRQCHACCAALATAAKKCPQCGQWQTKTLMFVTNPLVRADTTLMIGLVLILCYKSLPQPLSNLAVAMIDGPRWRSNR